MTDFMQYIDIELGTGLGVKDVLKKKISLKTRDINSVSFRIKLDTTPDSVSYLFTNKGRNVYYQDVATQDAEGRWIVPFNPELIRADSSNMLLCLYAKKGEQEKDVGAILFKTGVSAIDEGMVTDEDKVVYVGALENLIKDFGKWIEDYKATAPDIEYTKAIRTDVNKNIDDIKDLVDDVNSIIVPTKVGELENDRKYTPRDEVIELFNIIKPQGIEIVPQYQYGTNNVDDLNENFWWSDGKGENLWNTSYSRSPGFSWDNEITSTLKYYASTIMDSRYIITVLKPSETYSAQMNYTVGKIQGEPFRIWTFLYSILYRNSASGENPVEAVARMWESTPLEDIVEDKTYHRRGRFTTPSDLNFVDWLVYGLRYKQEDGTEIGGDVKLSKVKLEEGDIASPYNIGKLDHEARKTDYLWTRNQIWHADGTYSYTKARRA